VEDAVIGIDGLIESGNLCIITSRTSHSFSTLHPIEVLCKEDSEQTCQHAIDDQQRTGASVSNQCTISQDTGPTKAAAIKAFTKLTDWVNIL